MAAAAQALDPAGATRAPGEWFDEAGMAPPVSISEALHILKLHGGKPAGRARWQQPPRPLSDVQDELIARAEAIRRVSRREKLAAGWREHGETMIPPGWLRADEIGRCPRCGEERVAATGAGAEPA